MIERASEASAASGERSERKGVSDEEWRGWGNRAEGVKIHTWEESIALARGGLRQVYGPPFFFMSFGLGDRDIHFFF